MTIDRVARDLGVDLGELGLHGKGKIGALLETALGATGGSTATFDFPELEIELKSVPIGANGKPRESTYVCTLPLMDADRAEWITSWPRKKLSRVLFVPIEERTIRTCVLWEPNEEENAILRQDFDDIMGLLGTGGIESLTAHLGTALQVRPKAAHSGVRTNAIGPEDEIVRAVPRGFYLRASFVERILQKRVM